MVEYRERAAAMGRIPQNFFRRELRPTDNETLVSRLIDRSMRPLFPTGYPCATQIICNMLAVDKKHDPEVLSINGAAAALMLSDIPWNGPVAAIRIGLINDQFCINPSRSELNSSAMDVIVASTKDRIVMVEGVAQEISEQKLCEAVSLGFKEAQPIIDSLTELAHYRKHPTREVQLEVSTPELRETLRSLCWGHVNAILRDFSHKKASRDNALFAVLEEATLQLPTDYTETAQHLLSSTFWDICRECLRENILEHQIRCDGRGMYDLRPIQCDVDVFKPLHGSAVFKRGETQVFCSVTFDSPESAVKADLISILGGQRRRFMLHYEFPPFATNEIGRYLMPGRREIGHGQLAEKALQPLLLDGSMDDFPFTIRLSSQVTDSNGSSSMASVCGGSLALFDAGVPMKSAAAGVACGLIVKTKPDSDEIEKYQILADIMGMEDAIGNMDFKMAGTREGITSLQVDFKNIPGVPYNIFEEAVMTSRDARYKVLDIMDQCQSAPRPNLKENGPCYTTIDVPPEKRKRLVGTGGHRIKALVAETGADVQSVGDESMSVFAPTREIMDDVMEKIEAISAEPLMDTTSHGLEYGAIYPAKITEIRQYGMLVELAPGLICLLHNSLITNRPIKHPSELGLLVGDTISVKYLGLDPISKRHRISRKALLGEWN